MTETIKKQFILMLIVVFALQMTFVRVVNAGNTGDVVINEIAWAGSADSSNDEWIELYNTTGQSVDLTGWYIEDDGNTLYEIESGGIGAHGYFLIEKNEDAISNRNADAVIGLSLANAGDSLVLHDNTGAVVDTVNAGGGKWYAGNTDKATMERIDPNVKFDVAENWASAISGNGAISSVGSAVLGTPGGANSNYDGDGATVSLRSDAIAYDMGDEVSLSVEIADAEDLYAYGFDINYDPTVLAFVSAEEGAFLSGDGENTAFNFGLENGRAGKLVVGNARLINPAVGLDGAGSLLNLAFEVIGVDTPETRIIFGGGSFLSDSNGDVPAKFNAAKLNIGEQPVGAVKNPGISAGEERYSLELRWDEPLDGADSYIVQKKMPDGTFSTIGQTSETSLLDSDSLVPGLEYIYQIIAVKNGSLSSRAEVAGVDDRGLKGDTDRSDRVDGRDIEKLARTYGVEFGEEGYDPITDTNFDGMIDGQDLIDIGANFGLTY